MSQNPSGDKKIDLSNLPRGAIGIKGLPVSRNTRLPSIRTPRDLTLGAQPKRTFMPNIPVRREKKHHQNGNKSTVNDESSSKMESINILSNENQRARVKGRGQIIQTQGSIFSDGVSTEPPVRKDKAREFYQRSETSSSGVMIKKEKVDTNINAVNNQMKSLLRDDFIDDGDDDVMILTKPTIFPSDAQINLELKAETGTQMKVDNKSTAELGNNMNNVAKFIKQEKGIETDESMLSETLASMPETQFPMNNLLNADDTKLVLLQFPQNVFSQFEDSEGAVQPKRQADLDSQLPTDLAESPDLVPGAKFGSAYVSHLEEGHVGKLQLLKSGQVRLLLGSLCLELCSISQLQSKHEAACIKNSENSGDLTLLGSLESKMNFTNCIDSLI